MSAGVFKVTFLDEREPVEARFTPRVHVAIERKWPTGDRPFLEGMYFGLYVALGGDPKDADAFETFLDEVEDFEVVSTDDVDPSEPAATDG